MFQKIAKAVSHWNWGLIGCFIVALAIDIFAVWGILAICKWAAASFIEALAFISVSSM